MRHRRKGRVLGRSPSHQRALLKNLAAALFLTEKSYDADEVGAPKVAGRIITTLPKAKEVRPVVERLQLPWQIARCLPSKPLKNLHLLARWRD